MNVSYLPAVNATLNGVSAVLLFTARQNIKRGNRDTHKKLMIAAFSTSCVFLVSYLVYHFVAGAVYFQGQGIIRPIYFVLLFTHTVLAVTVPVFATISLSRGLKQKFVLHKKISRWTYPIWMYVSVTGVIIYVLLYQLYPPTPVAF